MGEKAMYHLSLTVKTYAAHQVISLSLYEATGPGARRLVRTYSQTKPHLAGGLFSTTQDEFLREVITNLGKIAGFLQTTDQ